MCCVGEAVTFPDYSQPSISTSYTDEVMHDGQIYADSEPSTREMPHNSNVFDEFSSEIYNEEDSCDFDGSCFPFLEGGYSIENEKWEPTSGMFFGSCDGEEFSPYSTFINSTVDISSSGKKECSALLP